jgi:hypothetical protein
MTLHLSRPEHSLRPRGVAPERIPRASSACAAVQLVALEIRMVRLILGVERSRKFSIHWLLPEASGAFDFAADAAFCGLARAAGSHKAIFRYRLSQRTAVCPASRDSTQDRIASGSCCPVNVRCALSPQAGATVNFSSHSGRCSLSR